jgi:hypothetical protein
MRGAFSERRFLKGFPIYEPYRKISGRAYSGKVVRHERAWSYREGVRNCTRDGGGPPGAGLQEQAPNHLKLRWLRARVVSVKDKSWLKTVAGEVQGDEHKRTTDEVSKH